jgi:nucleotide-binding universal stress UspA family protein
VKISKAHKATLCQTQAIEIAADPGAEARWRPMLLIHARVLTLGLACAMPLLRAASRVHLIHWRESDDDVHSLDDIERHLRLHGVEATRDEVVRANSGVGDAIVSFAIDVGADLIVMGCYGHRRLREIVLRGATRDVLMSTSVPVFMSH